MKKKQTFCVLRLISLCFFFSLLAARWDASSITLAAKPPTDKVPSPLLKWPEKGSEYAILVDKSLQKVFVYHRDDPYQRHRTYTCSTGENQGPKLRENDRKTPEGVYFFVRASTRESFFPSMGHGPMRWTIRMSSIEERGRTDTGSGSTVSTSR